MLVHLMNRSSRRCQHRLGQKSLRSGGFTHLEPCRSEHLRLIRMPLKSICSESALTRKTSKRSRSRSSSMILHWKRRFHVFSLMQQSLRPLKHSQTRGGSSKQKMSGWETGMTWLNNGSAFWRNYDKMPFFSSSNSFSISNHHHHFLNLCQGSLLILHLH